MDKRTYGCTYEVHNIDHWMYKWTDMQIDDWRDRQMNGWQMDIFFYRDVRGNNKNDGNTERRWKEEKDIDTNLNRRHSYRLTPGGRV